MQDRIKSTFSFLQAISIFLGFLFCEISIQHHLQAAIFDINRLTLEEKVGQLLMVHFNGEICNEEARALIDQAYVGGFIYYNWSNGLNQPEQVYRLSQSLQTYATQNSSKIPLFIAVDQEGGSVNRLMQGFTIFPSAYAIGQTHQPLLAKQAATAIAEELRSVGINMNLAPVCDVNSNPRNPIIGIRSFSSCPKEVFKYAEMAICGYKTMGMIPVAKHFPGHGDTALDSHEYLPSILHDKNHLDDIELFPFKQLIPTIDALMSAHLLVPSLDANHPITFSKTAIQGVLRERLNYQGLIMTDSLVMQGILNLCPQIEEAAIRSIEAGHDIILLGGKQLNTKNKFELTPADIISIHQALVNAVKSGRISQEQLDASVTRILHIKQSYKLPYRIDGSYNAEEANLHSHQQLAEQIAHLSVKVTSQKASLPLIKKGQTVIILAPENIQKTVKDACLGSLNDVDVSFYFFPLAPTAQEIAQAIEYGKKADTILAFTYDCWKHRSQISIIESLQNEKKEIAILAVANPQDLTLFPDASIVIGTFSPTLQSIQQAIKLLTHQSND